MISPGFKKLATDSGMKVSKGVAYGSYQGFAATFSDGVNIKIINFITTFPAAEQKASFMNAVNEANYQKKYRVQSLSVSEKRIQIVFTDTIGTLKKIQAFLDWFLPLLRQYGAAGANICTNCGAEITSGRWVLLDGAACHMHESCIKSIENQLEAGNQRRKDADTGTYAAGALGAFLGALLGAIVWALVMMAGYIAGLVGLLIGFLSNKGYELLKGKRDKGKIVILIFAVVFGVIAGTIAGGVGDLIVSVGFGYPVGDYFAASIETIIRNPVNLIMGFFLAAFGVFGVILDAGKEISDVKLTYLD